MAIASLLVAACNDVIGLTPGTLIDEGATGTGELPICVPSDTNEPVDDSCGVFVSSSKGKDGNAGTKAAPFATIQQALAASAGKPVYLCAESFTEAVEIEADVVIYGALDCSKSWKYKGAANASLIEAPSDTIALRVAAGINTSVYDLDIRAGDATAPGGSSIGLLAADGASVGLSRCKIETGNGQNGSDGEPYMTAAKVGVAGTDGIDACTASIVVPPQEPLTECSDAYSDGGQGGPGHASFGDPGSLGSPFRPDGAMNGGLGETNAGVACTPGEEGWDGYQGVAGSGATGLGFLDGNVGYVGAAGEDGKLGAPGQGGGGGGGAKGGTGTGKCPDAAKAGGASGGNGGRGGCGGLGGKGGQAGGASIGIVSLNATLSFEAVAIIAKNGGRAGDGGLGQFGGDGAPGGKGGKGMYLNLNDGCPGGKSGRGGIGGYAGGGRGGHSIGIAYTGDEPNAAGVSVTLGIPGEGGVGVDVMNDKLKGEPGVAAKAQPFD